ncbi:MAG: hypothetical protein IJA45_09000 [Oscillospiraceae bacterium]|nr:hypothetical protein [Oscillospiraceae bacterium]
MTQIKVQKTKEYFVYFEFYELKSWGKRSANNRRRFNQRLLEVSEAQSAVVNDSPVDCQSRRPGVPQNAAGICEERAND